MRRRMLDVVANTNSGGNQDINLTLEEHAGRIFAFYAG